MTSIQEVTRQQLERLKKGYPPAPEAGLFGGSLPIDDCQLVILPVPFELTTSYGKGTREGPELIRQASHQLDLFDLSYGPVYQVGITAIDSSQTINDLNDQYKEVAQRVINDIESGNEPRPGDLKQINEASEYVNRWVYDQAESLLRSGKRVAVLGGDHSTPFGLIKCLSDHGHEFGILHFDAHHDLRQAYEGFRYSHASIMYNVLAECKGVKRLVSLGIRDFSEEEFLMAEEDERILTGYDQELAAGRLEGRSFASVIDPLLKELPEKVYVSFDIDGLDPTLCPGTGTPVAGGLSFQEATFVLERLVKSGRQIIGFDLNEVAPSANNQEWDGNVGARMLYKLCGAFAISQKLSHLK